MANYAKKYLLTPLFVTAQSSHSSSSATGFDRCQRITHYCFKLLTRVEGNDSIYSNFPMQCRECVWNTNNIQDRKDSAAEQRSTIIVLASRVPGHHLDTQTLQNDPSGTPNIFVINI